MIGTMDTLALCDPAMAIFIFRLPDGMRYLDNNMSLKRKIFDEITSSDKIKYCHLRTLLAVHDLSWFLHIFGQIIHHITSNTVVSF